MLNEVYLSGTNLDMELPHGADATDKWDEAQKSVQADNSSSGEKSNIGLVPTKIKGKPTVEGGVKPKYKLYSVNLDENCIKKLANAINSEKGVAVVALYNRTSESVSTNIQLPLTPNQQRNVREKHVACQDARLRITSDQVKY